MTEAETKASLEKVLDKWLDQVADDMSGDFGTFGAEAPSHMAEACMVVLRVQRETTTEVRGEYE